MKIWNFVITLVIANLSLVSCGSHEIVCALPAAESLRPQGTTPIAPILEIGVTFKNISIHDFNNLVVEDQLIGDLASQTNKFHLFTYHTYYTGLYENAHIELSVGNRALESRPIDQVGEQPLEFGFYYTFSIDVDLDQELIITSVEKVGPIANPTFPQGSCY